MTLSVTSSRNYNSRKRFFPQTSRIDWGDTSLRNLATSLKSSFTWSKTTATGGGGDGSNMKSAAAAAARSLDKGFPFGSDDPYASNEDGIDISSDNAEKYDNKTNYYCERVPIWSCRFVLIAVATIGIIVGASVAGIAGMASLNGASVTSSSDSESINNTDDQQRLLEIAEEVVSACSENKLNEDLSDCQQLCREYMCCFEDEEYSCKDDGDKDCPVYAGCRALITIEGDLANAATATGGSQRGIV